MSNDFAEKLEEFRLSHSQTKNDRKANELIIADYRVFAGTFSS